MEAALRPRTRWVIQGYKSTQKTYETELPLGSLTEGEMVVLLQRLACRHLSEDDIVDASVRKSSKRHNPVPLEIDKESTAERFSMSVGHNPHYYIASSQPEPDGGA
jgi:hypothetical protein